MELSDGVITLRHPTEDDAPTLLANVLASKAELEPWMPWAAGDYDESNALAWIRGEYDPSEHRFLIVDGDGAVVGNVGLNKFDHLNRVANLGYWLRSDAVGHGYATRATRLVAAHGFAATDLEVIEIHMSVRNEPSRRVAERAGATYEGILRRRLFLQGEHHDVHVFTFTRGEVDDAAYV